MLVAAEHQHPHFLIKIHPPEINTSIHLFAPPTTRIKSGKWETAERQTHYSVCGTTSSSSCWRFLLFVAENDSETANRTATFQHSRSCCFCATQILPTDRPCYFLTSSSSESFAHIDNFCVCRFRVSPKFITLDVIVDLGEDSRRRSQPKQRGNRVESRGFFWDSQSVLIQLRIDNKGQRPLSYFCS